MKKVLVLLSTLLILSLVGEIEGIEAAKKENEGIQVSQSALRSLTTAVSVDASCEQVAGYEEQGRETNTLSGEEQAMTSGEESKEAYQAKGLACYKLGKFAEAHTNFTKAISLDADFAAAYLARSKNYRAIGAEMAAAADEAHWRALSIHKA